MVPTVLLENLTATADFVLEATFVGVPDDKWGERPMALIRLMPGATQTEDDVIAEIKAISGEDVRACYQCGKCTAGCPVAFAMEMGPHEVIRHTLLGLEEEVLKVNTFWLCICFCFNDFFFFDLICS
jgi:acyl-CoA synthetase (AMP-forming)/AMP-acid ligase II